MRAIGAVLGVALFWTGAAMANAPGAPEKPSEAAKPQIPRSVWRIDDDGSAEHLQSGWRCPGRIDDYAQGLLHVYDGFGLDVSCDYRKPGTLLTLYVTRVAPDFSFAGAYASAKDAVLKASPQRRPVLVAEDQTDAGGFKWSRAVFAEDGGVHSALWLTMLSSDWYFEYRATYPADQEAAVGATLAKLAGSTAGSAGERLKLCEAHLAPVRYGALVTDAKTLQDLAMMTSLVGAAAATAPAKDKALEPVQAFWCPEVPVHVGDMALLFWRGIWADGSDARIDRITGMTMGAAPELDIGLDAMTNLVEGPAAKGAKPAERWTATSREGVQTWIWGYFDGRPSSDAAAALFADVLRGKVKPVGGYRLDGKTIVINAPPGP